MQEALALDPDNVDLKKSIRNIKRAHDLKEEGTKFFKENNLDKAVEKFKECLDVDPMNIHYNATICFNIAMALSKEKKNEEALKYLN